MPPSNRGRTPPARNTSLLNRQLVPIAAWPPANRERRIPEGEALRPVFWRLRCLTPACFSPVDHRSPPHKVPRNSLRQNILPITHLFPRSCTDFLLTI